MKAMVLTGIRRMEMRDLPAVHIGNTNDVLLKIDVVGICGSDVHYYRSGRIGSQTVRYPFVVGHECAAIVEKVGSGVTRVKPGDRVAVDPAISCGECDQCRAGRPHTCRRLKFLGLPGQAEGCLTEYIVMPQGCCFRLEEGITLEQAVISEPLAIGLYAVKHLSLKGTRIGILGSGPIGLSVLLSAKARGAEKIYVTDKIDARLDVARKAGASWAGNPVREDIVKGITDAEPSLLDAVFECCGEQEAFDQAVELLKPGGKLMAIGIPAVDRISFNIHELRHKEISIRNVRRQNDCVQEALNLIGSGQISVDFMITHRYGFEQTREAFELAADYRDGVVKAIIEL